VEYRQEPVNELFDDLRHGVSSRSVRRRESRRSIMHVVTEHGTHRSGFVARIERWARTHTRPAEPVTTRPVKTRHERILEAWVFLGIAVTGAAWQLGGLLIGAVAFGAMMAFTWLLGRVLPERRAR
jgi:hypothetical protein